MSHKKFGPDRFSRFDVYWIQTNRQTDRQAKFIYRFHLCNYNYNEQILFIKFIKKACYIYFVYIISLPDFFLTSPPLEIFDPPPSRPFVMYIKLWVLAGFDFNFPIISGIDKLYQIKGLLSHLSAFTFFLFMPKRICPL